jgi:hypothetical protein
MNLKQCRFGVCALMLVSSLGSTPCPAALPGLDEKPWFGHFLAYEDKKFSFGLTSNAEGKLTPMGRSGQPISKVLALPLAFVVEEILPNGRNITKKILPDTLETKDPATTKPGSVSFRGKVTGGASFEGHIEVEHGVVAAGGRLLDPGTLRKNPLRFAIRVNFPSAYRNEAKADKKTMREFERKLKDDRFSILWTDGKRLKPSGDDKVDAGSKKINGPGIAELKVDVGAYQGKVFEFIATPNSRMELWSRIEQAFSDGFAINWYPDPATDPDGKSRLKFTVK